MVLQKLTGQREDAREAAHADVLKAQLEQQQQRTRDLADARLAAQKAHLELEFLLYPDPRTAFYDGEGCAVGCCRIAVMWMLLRRKTMLS